MNYRYSWIIDQRAILESGLDIDIVDFSIMRILSDFALSGNCKSMQADGYIWFYFSWKIIPQQAPILGIKSRQGVLRRFSKLKNNGLLVAHDGNQLNNDSWFRIGTNYESLLRKQPVNENIHGVNEKVQPVNEKVHEPVNDCLHPPVNERVHNKTINTNKTINNNIYVDSTEPHKHKFKNFQKPSIEECKEYCKAQGWKIEFAEVFIDGNEQRGWKLNGGRIMKDWRAAMRTWMRKDYNQKYISTKTTNTSQSNNELILDQIDQSKRERYITKVAGAISRFFSHKSVSNQQRYDYSYLSGMILINRFKEDHPNLFKDCLAQYHKMIIDNL